MKSSILSSISYGLAGGGTLDGDVTITGDLTVTGSSTNTYDEQVDGQVWIKDSTTSSSSQGGHLKIFSDDGANMALGHRLGVIEFAGAEDSSSTLTNGARIEVITDAHWSASENGAYMKFYITDGNATETERMRINAGGQVIVSPGTVTGSAATPQLAFGDGDTGFYESSDDLLTIAVGGTARWAMADVGGERFGGTGSGGGVLLATGGSSTYASHTFTADFDTGMRRASADVLALHAGGERMILDTNSRISLILLLEVAILLLVGMQEEISQLEPVIYVLDSILVSL
jgi:hypothetical protein